MVYKILVVFWYIKSQKTRRIRSKKKKKKLGLVVSLKKKDQSQNRDLK